MDELIKSASLPESVTPVVHLAQVVIATLVSAGLSMVLGVVYRRIHPGAGYSQNLVRTFTLVAMVTALIMTLIGSNIARAFSLVGAMSIIRFRSAIKDPLDVGFVFLAIAIGMGAGTGFYVVTIAATLLMLAVAYLQHAFGFGASPLQSEYLLTVRFPLDVDYKAALDPVLPTFFTAYSVAYLETARAGTEREVVYSVRTKPGLDERALFEEIAKHNENLKVSFREVRHAVEVP